MKLVNPVDLFQKVLKSGSVQQGRLLGLDVGNKYVGLAVSDIDNKIASPHSVLVRTKTNINLMAKDFQMLNQAGSWPGPREYIYNKVSELNFTNLVEIIIASRFSLIGLVVGYPFSIQGQNSVEAFPVRLFIEDLKNTGKLDGLSYTYWDENYTSKCVEALLEPLNLHPVEVKTIIDKFAAVGILQGYLDHMQRETKTRGKLKEVSDPGFSINEFPRKPSKDASTI